MGGSKQTLTSKVRQGLFKRVEEYRDNHGYDSRSKAVEDLVETGLRESERPLVHRWRDQLLTWSGWIMVVSILSVLAGTTGVLGLYSAMKFTAACLLLALLMISVSEVLGFVSGQSELGAWFREKLGWDDG